MKTIRALALLLTFLPGCAFALGNALTMTATTYDTATPHFGTAALMGGFGTAPASIGLSGTTFTWEAWVRLAAAPGAPIVAFGSAAAGYIGANSAGAAVCNVAAGNTTITGPSIIDNKWHLLDLVGQPNGIACYVDGNLAGTSTVAEIVPPAAGFAVGTMGLYPSSNNWTGELDEVSVWSVAKYKAPFTPPASASVGTESGLVALWHLNGTGIDNAADTVVAPASSNILYSPMNWTSEANSTSTITAGAYFRTMFTGNSCFLNFDTADATTPASEIYTRVDGYGAGSGWTRTTPGANVNCSPSPDLAAAPWHVVEMVVKSTSQTVNRWNASAPGTVVRLAGISLAQGSSTTLPYAAPWTIAVFGDSVVEGVRTVNQTAANDTDQNDATLGWAYQLGRDMGAEVGVIGFGGQGFTVVGAGGVPIFPTSFGLLSSGVTRQTTQVPQLIVINMGTNDPAATSVVTPATNVLNGLLANYPHTPIALLVPFNQAHANDLQAAAAACSNPAMVSVVQTAGLLQSSYGVDSTGIHPTGPNNLAVIAPRLASVLQQIIVANNPLATGANPGLN